MRTLAKWAGLAALLALFAAPCWAVPEEVTSDIDRYKGYEVSNGFYEQYEVRPNKSRPYLIAPEYRTGVLSLGPSAAQVRNRGRLADSHMGVRFYTPWRACTDCHEAQARTRHVVREKITCRQCHGGEPIPDIEYYYSPMNSMRRHAYVCAKCHQGASYSFASYVIHEPNPAMAATQGSFPFLFWAFWAMAAIAVLTFALFLPHTFLWGVRELFTSRKRKGGKP